jgi:hypothetical protein
MTIGSTWGTIREIGDDLIPKDILKNFPREIKGDIKNAPIMGKIFNDDFAYYIISYNPDADELFCLARIRYKFEYDYVKLKELEGMGSRSKNFSIPVFMEPKEFASGDGHWYSEDNNYTVEDILIGYIK